MSKITQKPNIVLIMADQLAPQFLPCYGHPVVKAPALQRLAEEGVVFDAAYTNSPLCSPARFVMMSGRLPSKIAAWDNAVEFSSEIPTFAHYLAAEGYLSCLSGKMHFVGADQLHGYQQRLTTDVYPSDFSWHPDWDHYQQRLDWFHNMEVVTKAGICTRSMYMDYDDEVVFKAKRFLFDQAREGGEKPFMLTVSMIQPHDPYLCREEHWNLYRDEDIDLPKVPYGSVEEDPHSSRLRYGYGANEYDFDDATLRNARHAYYGSISDIDEKVGDIMRTIEQAGFKDNTIVIFLSDHGDMLGERGMWFKMSFFENSARIPLIVHAPKMFQSKRISSAVSLADVLPTLVEMARDGREGDYATPIEGRSLLPHLSGGSGHDEVIGEYFGEGSDTPIFMLRRAGHKLIYSGCDPAQAYDVASDPLEKNNLIDSAQHAEFTAQAMREIEAAYNIDALKSRVLESQHRRAFLKNIMLDQRVNWDYQLPQRSHEEYVRNSMPIYQLEKRARFPPV
jgi:choline-sulfatase